MQHTADIQQLQSRATVITAKLAKLNGSEDQHLQGVAKHFHLGMVGGSGKNIHKLNQRRERAMDKSIAVAKEVTELYKELNTIEAKIKDLQDGGPEKRAKAKEDRAALKAQYWNKLKAGDSINIGNGPSLIIKKNKKSLVTQSGCKWSAADIIGKDAAELI